MSADPQNGRLAAYRRKWFGKIIDRYRGSRTKIIFIRLARGPILRPDNLVKKLSSSIREFAFRPNVILADEHTFDSLEHPEFYKDGVHLNREGAARFSQMLSDLVTRILGAPDQHTAR
jgi:lysophospholipase L1-like esterase